MGLELTEQLDWNLPDALIYLTGGGTGIVGMWKACDELEALGWIGPKHPKMISVQTEGCAPIVKAFVEGERFAEMWSDALTIAPGIRVLAAVADYLILDAIRQSADTAMAVSDAANPRRRGGDGQTRRRISRARGSSHSRGIQEATREWLSQA